MNEENKTGEEIKQQGKPLQGDHSAGGLQESEFQAAGQREFEAHELERYPNPWARESRQLYMQQQALRKSAPPVYKTADKLLLAGAFLLGLIFVWFFYDKSLGISVPLFLIVFYALLFAYTGPVLNRKAMFGWLLCSSVFMLSLTFFIFSNEILSVLNVLMLPWLILLQTILVTGANSYKWFSPGILIDLLYSAFVRCLMHISKPFGVLSSIVRSKIGGDGKKSVGSRVIVGLVISVPILLILLLLLSSADMVFGKIVEGIPNFFESLDLNGLLPKLILALFVFFTSFSYMWSLAHCEKLSSGNKGAVPPKVQEEKGSWDPVILVTITAAIDFLYIFFVVIQFTYLFGRYGLPDGFTYSEYARNGFSELVLVSLLNIGLLALTLTQIRKGSLGLERVFKVLNSVMVCCTFVMLFSAYYRMSLYEQAYGFTFLRIMTQAFMIFLFVLFVITMARVWNDRLPLVKPYIIAAVIAFVVINYINVDVMIAQKNIQRYYETGNIDVSYFNHLSNAAVKELKELNELTKDKNPEVASEAHQILKQRKEMLSEKTDWQSFNLDDYFAGKEILQYSIE